jgi:hypothetical protein
MNEPALLGLTLPPLPAPRVESYESKLNRDPEWAMHEGSEFFRGAGEVQRALRKITRKLGDLGIDYAVVGGMAAFRHGYRRFTEDVDLLVTREGLAEIHRQLEGLGYVPPFSGSKNLRDAENGVKIEFLVTGDYPGDGKPKPVAFPIPAAVAEELDGIRYIRLANLIELKLASGMTDAGRMKDLADVLELIKALGISADFAGSLDPFVQPTFRRLWADANPSEKRYVALVPPEWQLGDAKSLDELIDRVDVDSANRLRSMRDDGVTLVRESAPSGDRWLLAVHDPAIAKKHDLHGEDEFLRPDAR